jgi:hypothetical protein
MFQKLTMLEFEAVRRALAAGARHVEIARELNLSVWTIALIANNRRYETEDVDEVDLPVDDAPAEYEAKNLRRCGGCGAMIYVFPCVACQLAGMTQRVPPAPEVDDFEVEDADEGVELAPCGRRRRRKASNRLFRAKLAQRGRWSAA